MSRWGTAPCWMEGRAHPPSACALPKFVVCWYQTAPAARASMMGHSKWMNERQVYADRGHRYRAPIAPLFAALTTDRYRWLLLQPGEIEPDVLETVPTQRVVWSSFWPTSPDDTIKFELTREGHE